MKLFDYLLLLMVFSLLAGCANQPPEPDPVATVVLKESQTVDVDVAVAVRRTPPLDLMQPVDVRLPVAGPARYLRAR